MLKVDSEQQPKLGIKVVEFLKRDVRSFLPGWKGGVKSLNDGAFIEAVDERLEPILDPSKVADFVLRREILDWRDEFHVSFTLEVSKLHNKFIKKVDEELKKIGIFRQIFSKSTSDALGSEFIREVRVPLFATLANEETKLNLKARIWTQRDQFTFVFKKHSTDSEYDGLIDLSFKPSNRDEIINRIEALMLGEVGIAETYRIQATCLAHQLMKEKQLC